jgi:NAD(P)-dependent dehydrogenase (short-subunit alcohol dehydrogenase family)
MAGRLHGKVIVITGAARGIGAETARLCVGEGAKVVLGDLREGQLKEVAEELDSAAVALAMDVTSDQDWAHLIETGERHFGRIDGLFNNAGIVDMTGLEGTPREVWDSVIAVNQTGVWLGLRAAVPALRRAGGGSIVNTSSIYGLIGGGGATAYQASKGAVRLLTKSTAVEFATEGIRINSIHPGVINTEMVSGGVPIEAQEHLMGLTPMGRLGRAEEVGWMAVFLLSDEASYVTGAEFVVDGGFTAA